MNPSELDALYALARDACGPIVEIGSYRGQSTCALALGSKAGNGWPVYAVDPHEEHEDINGAKYGPEDFGGFYEAVLETGVADIVRPIALPWRAAARVLPEAGLLFIDAEHTYQETHMQAFYTPKLRGCVTVLDDVNTEGVAKVVEEMEQHGHSVELVPMKVAICRP